MEGGDLARLWKGGKHGRLSPLMQAKAWGLSEAGVAQVDIAAKLEKIGGGHPTKSAVCKLLERIKGDPEWYPGKRPDASYGPAPVLRGAKRKQVAASAMTLKRRGVEPTYASVVAQCPEAVVNPGTGKAVDKHLVYKVLKEDCHDDGAEEPWVCEATIARGSLLPAEREKRRKWAKELLDSGHTGAWFHKHVIWTDISNSILPGNEKKAFLQTMARKRRRRWHSPDAKGASENFTPSKDALKQCAFHDSKVWWAPVLTRGKLEILIFDEDFPGETADGATLVIDRIPGVLARRFPNAKRLPRYVFVDRGRGFYTPAGHITIKFKEALARAGLRPFAGEDASSQPPNIADILPHETVTSWIRSREAKGKPKRPWLETRKAFKKRMGDIAREINRTLDVEGACRGVGHRLEEVLAADGDRLLRGNSPT